MGKIGLEVPPRFYTNKIGCHLGVSLECIFGGIGENKVNCSLALTIFRLRIINLKVIIKLIIVS